MKEHVLRFIGAVFLTIIALMGISAVLHVLLTLPWNGKGPEWVGAIGTVATLIGTIWLAMSGERKRRSEARDRGFVAAAGIRLQLEKVRASLEGATDHFSDTYFTANHGIQYKIQSELIKGAGTWTDEQVLPLIVVPNHVCARLVAVREEIADLVEQLAEMHKIQGYSWVQEGKAQRDAIFLDRLRDYCDTVSSCLIECRKFMRAIEASHHIDL